MSHYNIKSLGDGPNRWIVIHKGSGLQVTALGPLASVTKDEATQWKAKCELRAPTEDRVEAGRKLASVAMAYAHWIKCKFMYDTITIDAACDI